MLVELKEIKKKYGKQIILKGINLSIPKGQASAIIGGNGTGKSTLLKMIAGFIAPTTGTIQKQPGIKIGYVPEHFPEDIRFTLEDYLYHLGRIHGLSQTHLQKKIPEMLELFHLEHANHSVIRNFSKGMKQKTGIMQALLSNVDMLILDEPLSGLDPKSQQELEDILLTLKQQGLTVLFTCHEKQLLENFADRVVTLANHTIAEDKLLLSDKIPQEHIYIEATVPHTFSITELQKQSGYIHVAYNAKLYLIQLQIEKNYTGDILQYLLHEKAFITLLHPNS
ncbi:ABC transporter ATP-binding protein [Bacillus sp. DX1.1]|uniref:ABC transporter ATP-binding protein n=1 Tax=unclassified Bacillus (in: firmicutes) TaxID=185979 RepID=UPI00257019A4|nr:MULTISPECIES: ABC transporter ATP-binding protein [unclassified Bacillus (in: firmicutes)]MDM5156917.1 ABC transporter ATP-binding protein [Bacillus sp. DX1.1]WJE81160.1 ABC transporter ATP-binding protein [Bacillus sp. DX3.1]